MITVDQVGHTFLDFVDLFLVLFYGKGDTDNEILLNVL